MAHINYHRNVRFYGRLPLAEALPTENWQANFAAFCGRIEQRREAGLQAIRRCIGRVGIILLQNDSLLAEEIERLPEALPAPGSSRQDVGRIYSINPPASSVHYIAPLYGMNHEEVLNAIIPTSGDNDSRAAVVAARDGLNAYLRILELQFLHSRARNPQFSGRSPYRLDLLEQLVALSYQDLDRQVLNQLPETERRPIRETLSSDGRILLVRGWVNDFTSLMSSTLWTRQSEVRHGTIGIRDAMLHRSLINISLPNPSPALLRYLLCELNSLRTANIDFLLVAAEDLPGGFSADVPAVHRPATPLPATAPVFCRQTLPVCCLPPRWTPPWAACSASTTKFSSSAATMPAKPLPSLPPWAAISASSVNRATDGAVSPSLSFPAMKPGLHNMK